MIMNRHDRAEVRDDSAGRFEVVIRGYDRVQVHGRLDRLARELGVLRADRDASAARAEKLTSDLAAAHTETKALREKAQAAGEPTFQSMGARISSMLRLAEDEAADIRRVAREEQTRSRSEVESLAEECALMRTEAQGEAQRVVEDAHDEAGRALEEARDEARRALEEARNQARRALEEAHDDAAKMVADAQKRCDEMSAHARAFVEQAETEGKSRMAKVVEDFDLTLKSRRAESDRIEQEREHASRDEAVSRIEQAHTEAENMVAVAEDRVAELEARSAEIDTWLTQLRETLATVPPIDATADPSPIRAASRPTASGRHAAAATSPVAARHPVGSAGASTTPNSGSEQAPDVSPDIARSAAPSGSEAHSAIHADDPVPDSDGARPDRTVLGREDILEYRHTRRRVR